jgi:hypothetical protein
MTDLASSSISGLFTGQVAIRWEGRPPSAIQKTAAKGKQQISKRWQRGESLSSIGRRFNRASSSIYPLLARTGGIRPPARVRSRLALSPYRHSEVL